MKNICLPIICLLLLFSCKHDHEHNKDGTHTHEHKESHAHDHGDGHTHDHKQNHVQHEGHSHANHGDIQLVPVNTISAEEKAAGWTLLFDGENLDHWTGYKSDRPSNWVAKDNMLFFDPKGGGEGGDIQTKKQYKDFEFAMDWRISKCGNSGIMWNVVENPQNDRTFQTGPEMQILDNDCHSDAKIQLHRAGDLYDLIETSVVNVKPAMQWNSIKITSKEGNYTFHQNGEKVVEFAMHTPKWKKMVADSKFAEWPEFGKATQGHIAIQDHGNPVWFRNIRIREL